MQAALELGTMSCDGMNRVYEDVLREMWLTYGKNGRNTRADRLPIFSFPIQKRIITQRTRRRSRRMTLSPPPKPNPFQSLQLQVNTGNVVVVAIGEGEE